MKYILYTMFLIILGTSIYNINNHMPVNVNSIDVPTLSNLKSPYTNIINNGGKSTTIISITPNIEKILPSDENLKYTKNLNSNEFITDKELILLEKTILKNFRRNSLDNKGIPYENLSMINEILKTNSSENILEEKLLTHQELSQLEEDLLKSTVYQDSINIEENFDLNILTNNKDIQ